MARKVLCFRVQDICWRQRTSPLLCHLYSSCAVQQHMATKMQIRISAHFQELQSDFLPSRPSTSARKSDSSSNPVKALTAYLTGLTSTPTVASSGLVWPEAASAEAYSLLLQAEQAGWSSVKVLKELAAGLPQHGTLCIQQLACSNSHSEQTYLETSLALSLFFTCHMLQRTEVC